MQFSYFLALFWYYMEKTSAETWKKVLIKSGNTFKILKAGCKGILHINPLSLRLLPETWMYNLKVVIRLSWGWQVKGFYNPIPLLHGRMGVHSDEMYQKWWCKLIWGRPVVHPATNFHFKISSILLGGRMCKYDRLSIQVAMSILFQRSKNENKGSMSLLILL